MITNTVELTTKEAVMKKKLQLSLKLISLKPVSHTVADQLKLVSYTDSSSEEEDLHVDVNFDEPIDLPLINFLLLKRISKE